MPQNYGTINNMDVKA